MNEPAPVNEPARSIDELLDALKNGSGDDRAQAAIRAKIESDPELASQAALQEEIDQSIRRSFQPPASVDLSFLQRAKTPLNDEPPVSTPVSVSLVSPSPTSPTPVSPVTVAHRSNRPPARRLVLLAIAACVAWFAVGGQIYFSSQRNRDQVAFRQRPLTSIYQECVRDGFEPYWVCDDEALFASTFKSRQGRAVCLRDLPPNHAMVGLSYLAGISLESTSLLAKAGDVPVIVFVDRLDRDWNPPTGRFEDEGLSVTRSVRDGLVFYEVSPLAEPVFMSQLMTCE